MSSLMIAFYILLGTIANRCIGGNPRRLANAIMDDSSLMSVPKRKRIFKYALWMAFSIPIVIGLVASLFSYQPLILFAIGFLLNFVVFVIPKIEEELIYFDFCDELMKLARERMIENLKQKMKDINVKEH